MSQKYRQKGYQDAERAARSEGASGGGQKREPYDRFKPDRPRGRGLGAPTCEVFKCAVCGTAQDRPEGREAACVKCSTDLHTCTHCQHFDTSAQFECRQELPARVGKKSTRNECELFAPKVSVDYEADKPKPTAAKSAFDALFKDI